MKKIIITSLLIVFSLSLFAQNDSIYSDRDYETNEIDTIEIYNQLIKLESQSFNFTLASIASLVTVGLINPPQLALKAGIVFTIWVSGKIYFYVKTIHLENKILKVRVKK